jgi:predicted nuclease with TOPRIM domain
MTAEGTKVFDSLEKRIEKVLERYRSAIQESAKLKTRLSESEAEVDRVKQELAGARKSAKREEELASEVKRFEEENEKVRQRLSRLIESLETIDANRG